MIDIFIRVVFKKDTQRYKIPYIIGILAPPIVFSWIPFIKLAYGPAGVSCWIRDREYGDRYLDCMSFPLGTYLRFALYYVPFYVCNDWSINPSPSLLYMSARRKKRRWIGARNFGERENRHAKKDSV